MKTDIEISQQTKLLPIQEVGRQVGLEEADLELYGPYKAKISLEVLHRLEDKPDGRLVLVTAMTPTPAGEGKTTNTIGLTQALWRMGKKAILAIPRAFAGTKLRLERRGGGRRLLPGAAYGGHQPPLHRRHPRGDHCPQPAGGGCWTTACSRAILTTSTLAASSGGVSWI